MKYRVVSEDRDLLTRTEILFKKAGIKEAKHIQEVDFWLVDMAGISKEALTTYQNKQSYSFFLFIVNSDDEVELLLSYGFTNYLWKSFKEKEFFSWCKFCTQQNNSFLESNLDLEKRTLLYNKEEVELTLQEFELLKLLSNKNYISTQDLTNSLNLKSQTSVRTLINRVREKTDKTVIVQKRGFGYKLDHINEKEKASDEGYVKDLEEEKKLLQSIVDNSSIFIVTFVHKKLYCINESFREYLGVELIKELWQDAKGDFSQILKEGKLEDLFLDGEHLVELFAQKEDFTFIVKTIYFKKLDKHLLVFTPQSR